jgi:subtilisin family serine protease
MREYNVILKKDVDYDSFWNDIESDTDGGKLYIPNRAVEYTNERPTSLRQCWYRLTDEEAELVRQDDRVLAVEIPPEHRDDIQLVINRTQSSNGSYNIYTKTTSNDGAYVNWGLVRSNYKENVYSNQSIPPFEYQYVLDGTGVDVVIQDSGLQVDHPEFEDEFGNNRVQQINWYSASGITGTQSVNHYRDYDGHGTHVAGIAAGRYYGWAKNARIYSQKLNGLEGTGDSGTGISITDAFDTIKGWHMAKSGSIPTVVNMSWGYGRSYTSVSEINYRGVSYTGVDIDTDIERQNNYGLMDYIVALSPETWQTNVRVSSVDTDIQEMIDAGIVVVIAAGNRNHKIATSGSTDYDNYAVLNTGTTYYHRGSSPYDEQALIVGSVDRTVYDDGVGGILDRIAVYSERGPGVDIYAPGTSIMSACSTTYDTTQFAPQNYQANFQNNASFKQMNISGTSMAAPQVAGVSALLLQLYPNISSGSLPSTVKSKLLEIASSSLYFTGQDDDYSDRYSTLTDDGAKILYNPFSANEPIQIQGSLSFAGVGLEFR